MRPTNYDEIKLPMARELEINVRGWCDMTEDQRHAIGLAMAAQDYVVWRHAGTEWVREYTPLEVLDNSPVVMRVLGVGYTPKGLTTFPYMEKDSHTNPVPITEEMLAGEWERQAWQVQIYVAHGYFEYEVFRMEQALEHAEVIMRGGTYRRSTESGDVEVHKALKVKVKGPGLKSEYLDTFKRT